MRTPLALALVAALAASAHAQRQGNDDFYFLGPDSLPHDGVPHGETKGPFTLPSQAYPGTQHTYWIYVPAQYDGKEPTALMVFQDGHAFLNPEGQARVPNVIDNLLFRREIPTMITVFINPGRTPEQQEPSGNSWGDAFTNRRVEYNSLDDNYARVICDELLPVLKKDYNISDRPEDRGIGGASSGAIAAFTVAWHRPDQFGKVLSIVGSFTDIRGGHQLSNLVRFSEKKPIRVFLVDGRNDNREPRRRVRRQHGLVQPKRPHAQRAGGKGLRRQLPLEHQQARPEGRRGVHPRNDAVAVARPMGFHRVRRRRGTLLQRAHLPIKSAMVSPVLRRSPPLAA